MSYDLVVWKAPLTAREEELVERLGRFGAGDLSAFEPHPDVAAFHRELLQKFPPLEELSDDEVDEPGKSPWSLTPDESDRVVMLNMVWDASDKVRKEIVRLVEKHRLALYDPQGSGIHPPKRK